MTRDEAMSLILLKIAQGQQEAAKAEDNAKTATGQDRVDFEALAGAWHARVSGFKACYVIVSALDCEVAV